MTYKVLGVLAILAVFMVGNAALATGGVWIPGYIGDRVWWDSNGDGNQDAGEDGIKDVWVTLTMVDGTTPAYDVYGHLVEPMQTGDNGLYKFTNLPAGVYRVTVLGTELNTNEYQLPGFPTWDYDGIVTPNTAVYELKSNPYYKWMPDDTLNLDWNAVWDEAYIPKQGGWYDNEGNSLGVDPDKDGIPVNVVYNSTLDVDFGYVGNTTTFGSIGDTVWNDIDKDGVLDSGEPGIVGAQVRLIQDSNKNGTFGDTGVYNGQIVTDMEIVTTTTNTTTKTGYYHFGGLALDYDYRIIVESLPAAPDGGTWKQTYDKDDGLGPFVSPNRMTKQLLPETKTVNGQPVTINDVDDVDFGYVVVEPPPTGPFFTYTQGGWGAKPAGNNPGMLLSKNWDAVFGVGGILTVGTGTYKITLTSAKAVENFLPQGGTAYKLTQDYLNPTQKTSAGVLAGQVTALKLSVLFSHAGITTNGLDVLKATKGILAGKTVAEILAICEAALGGADTGYTYAQLNEVATAINENFDNGTTNNGYLAGP